MRGFTHSGGARRIKAGPTGRPDKPDQKEYTERRGVHLVCMRGESQRDVNPATSPPPPPLLALSTTTQTHAQTGGARMHSVNSIVGVGTDKAVSALVLSGSISAAAQPYQRPSGFCSARAAKAARAPAAGGSSGGVTISRLNTSLWYSPDVH